MRLFRSKTDSEPVAKPGRFSNVEALDDWDTGGLIGLPVDFEGHEIGVGQIIQWSVADDGTLSSEAISDWLEVKE